MHVLLRGGVGGSIGAAQRLSTAPHVAEAPGLVGNIGCIRPRVLKRVLKGLITEERVRTVKHEGDDPPARERMAMR
ncbi:MAG TPA: hypothetical protein ENN11_00785 [Methanomicrobia archaeon]|nr:hypothetical protein [Methanomicrobia archaeon]